MDIRTFARIAGVSIATVSRAFSGKGRIDPETKKTILELAQKKGFTPNVHARRLSSKESAMLGVFYSFSSEPVFDYYNMELAQELAKAALNQGYATQLELTSSDALQEQKIVQLATTGAIDGLILVVGGIDRARQLLERIPNCPCVAIANAPWPDGTTVAGSVFIDFRAGIEQAILRLHKLGHTKIGYIRGMVDDTKHKAYLNAMKKAGITPKAEWVQPGYKSFSDGEKAAGHLLKAGVSAILCATDILALGVMHAAEQKKVRIPEDLSIIGMDDLALSAYTTPALSSIGVPRQQVGEVAVESLMRSIRDIRNKNARTTYFQTVHPAFVERRSVGAAPKK